MGLSITPAGPAVPVTAPNGGTGVANNAASTLTISGNFGTTITVTGTTAITLPTSGTVATTATFASPPALGSGTPAAVTGTVITATTEVVVPIGSATVPTVRGASESNTGISFPSASTINFVAGGDRKWAVAGDNLVGYGNSFGQVYAPANGGYSISGRDVAITAPGAYWVIGAGGGSAAERLRVTATSVTVASGTNFQLGNNAVTGLTAGVLAALTTASIVIYDATGTAYRVPCITP